MRSDEVRDLVAPYVGVLVDVGTGDGRLPYQCARSNPTWFHLGLDPNRSGLMAVAAKARRKPMRGGASNLAFVCASVEAPPPELSAIAQRITVIMPWGYLLSGLVTPLAEVLAGLASLGAKDARVDVIFNGEVWLDARKPNESLVLPEPTIERIDSVLTDAYSSWSLIVDDRRLLSRDEAGHIPSSWTRRLLAGRPSPQFVWMQLRVGG